MHMYLYDAIDRRLVAERIAQFRDQVRRRLSGELSETEFKPQRLRNGLYMQLHAYMLRVAIPYGLLNSEQMRTLGTIARVYDRGYGHFTTRQNIQFNWPQLTDVPDILADLAAVEMHAMQTSGNCIRNITSDHYAGVAADEIEDPRPYAELIRQWSTLHPEFSFLPRKFKIAVSASAEDRAATRFHDIGLLMTRDASARVGFRVLVGGGLGRTPVVGQEIRAFLPKEDLLPYLEAILRVYNLEGRRDNIYKARIKILVTALGIDAFRDKVEAEFRAIAAEPVSWDGAEIDRIAAHFRPPPYAPEAVADEDLSLIVASSPAFACWTKANVRPHKRPGYAIVDISLKPVGGIPGDVTAEQMEGLADLADAYSFGMIRVSHRQNLVLADVRRVDLPALWRGLERLNLAAANVGRATDIIACPGLDFCSLANARSIPVAQRIADRLDALDSQFDLGDLRINVSGCINACGHHHVGHIGLLGVDKKGEEFYQITLGGSSAEDAAIGTILGQAVSSADVAAAIETLALAYVGLREPGERFLGTVRRLGIEPFREALYGADQRPAAG